LTNNHPRRRIGSQFSAPPPGRSSSLSTGATPTGIGSHPGDSTHYVNAKDMLSLSLLQARLVDLGMPIKIVGGYLEVQMRLWLKVKNRHIRRAG